MSISSHEFGTPVALVEGEAKEGQHTLRITFQETDEAVEMRLEGRVAGPWASELDRVWVETAPQLAAKKLIIDLHNVTYADAAGKQVLREIYAQTHADIYREHSMGPISGRRNHCKQSRRESKRRVDDADDARNNDQFQKPGTAGTANSSTSCHQRLCRILSRWSSPRCISPGVQLFSEKSDAEGIFIVVSGEVKLSINSSDGKRLILSIAKAGRRFSDSRQCSPACRATMTAETLYPRASPSSIAISSSLLWAAIPRSTRW